MAAFSGASDARAVCSIKYPSCVQHWVPHLWQCVLHTRGSQLDLASLCSRCSGGVVSCLWRLPPLSFPTAAVPTRTRASVLPLVLLAVLVKDGQQGSPPTPFCTHSAPRRVGEAREARPAVGALLRPDQPGAGRAHPAAKDGQEPAQAHTPVPQVRPTGGGTGNGGWGGTLRRAHAPLPTVRTPWKRGDVDET